MALFRKLFMTTMLRSVRESPICICFVSQGQKHNADTSRKLDHMYILTNRRNKGSSMSIKDSTEGYSHIVFKWGLMFGIEGKFWVEYTFQIPRLSNQG